MLLVDVIEEKHRDYWDDAIAGFSISHPLNAYGWGQVRRVDGWSPTYYLARRDGVVAGGMVLMTKRLPVCGFSIVYGQKGPVCELSDEETLRFLLKSASSFAKENNAIFMRIDPNILEDDLPHLEHVFAEGGFAHLEHRWSFWNSPRDVYRIDLSKYDDSDQLFNSLDRDTRRCVRKSHKDGVIIRPAESIAELQAFYAIFKEFTVGKGFMCRSYSYQESLWEQFIERGKGRLFLAVFEGKIIGGLICLLFGGKCLAMHMGTPYQYQKLQTYYAYVWESIKWAKEQGCIWYSFRGVGTTPTQEKFKKKFGPTVVALAGYYDLPVMPALYRLFSFGEFEMLPRTWRTLMSLRQDLNEFNIAFKQKSRG